MRFTIAARASLAPDTGIWASLIRTRWYWRVAEVAGLRLWQTDWDREHVVILGARSACQVTRQILRATSSSFDLPATLPLIHQQWLGAIDPTTPRDAATTLLFGRVTDQGEVHAAYRVMVFCW